MSFARLPDCEDSFLSCLAPLQSNLVLSMNYILLSSIVVGPFTGGMYSRLLDQF